MEGFIERELDFNDVLILPQPSSLSSRNQVNLERTINFVNILDDNNNDEVYGYKKIEKNGQEFQSLLLIWILLEHLMFMIV